MQNNKLIEQLSEGKIARLKDWPDWAHIFYDKETKLFCLNFVTLYDRDGVKFDVRKDTIAPKELLESTEVDWIIEEKDAVH